MFVFCVCVCPYMCECVSKDNLGDANASDTETVPGELPSETPIRVGDPPLDQTKTIPAGSETKTMAGLTAAHMWAGPETADLLPGFPSWLDADEYAGLQQHADGTAVPLGGETVGDVISQFGDTLPPAIRVMRKK